VPLVSVVVHEHDAADAQHCQRRGGNRPVSAGTDYSHPRPANESEHGVAQRPACTAPALVIPLTDRRRRRVNVRTNPPHTRSHQRETDQFELVPGASHHARPPTGRRAEAQYQTDDQLTRQGRESVDQTLGVVVRDCRAGVNHQQVVERPKLNAAHGRRDRGQISRDKLA
jgi:hypothetical protein